MVTIPTCDPSAPISRTLGARIRSLIRLSGALEARPAALFEILLKTKESDHWGPLRNSQADRAIRPTRCYVLVTLAYPQTTQRHWG